MSTIPELEHAVHELEVQLTRARSALTAAKVAVCPVKIGDVVRCRGKEYRVTNIDVRWRKPWLNGNPRKADGTFSKAVRNLYGYWTTEDQWEPAGVGNTWSDYRCKLCGHVITVAMEDSDDHAKAQHRCIVREGT